MGIGDILCEYIYGSFLLIKASLEVAQKSAKTMLRSIETLFNTLLSLCRFVVDVGLKTILDGVKVIQKWLVDQILNFDYSKICAGMFKCTALLDEIFNPNALLTRTLTKYTNYNPALQTEIYSIVGDFNEFKETVCNFGFTYNFGISGIKALLTKFEGMCEQFFKMLERNKNRIMTYLQRYIDHLIDTGVFDMLDKLKKFFDCVLIDTEICSNIRTANSFYNDMLSKMGIEESGDGYRLDAETSNAFMNAFDSRINQINNSKQEIQKLIDSVLSPSQVRAANNAFNLASNIFPGGVTLDDLGTGEAWKKNKCYQYFKMKRRGLKSAIEEGIGNFDLKEQASIASSIRKMSTDSLLAALKIKDNTGEFTLTVIPDKTDDNSINAPKTIIKFTKDNLPKGNAIELVSDDTEYSMNTEGAKFDMEGAFYDEKTDTIISNLRTAIEMTVLKNEDIKNQVYRKVNYEGFVAESDAVKQI